MGVNRGRCGSLYPRGELWALRGVEGRHGF